MTSNGSIYRRADGKWVAQIYETDQLTEKTRKIRKYRSTRKAARAALEGMRKAPSSKLGRRDVTLAEFLQHYANGPIYRTGISPKTIKDWRRHLKRRAIPTAGEIALVDFTPGAAELWLERLSDIKTPSGRTPSTSTIRQTFLATKRALDFAVRDKYIASNPLSEVAAPQPGRTPVPATSPEELDRALEQARGKRIEPLLWFVAYTGCRISEALNLRWADVDLSEATATFWKTKNKQPRTVRLIPEVVDQLRSQSAWQAEQKLKSTTWGNDEGYVFTTKTGRQQNRHNASRDLCAVLEQAGVTTRRPWHSLRHGLATRLLRKGVPMPVVSAILGHSGIQITVDTYGHIDAAIDQDVLAQALSPSSSSRSM